MAAHRKISLPAKEVKFSNSGEEKPMPSYDAVPY